MLPFDSIQLILVAAVECAAAIVEIVPVPAGTCPRLEPKTGDSLSDQKLREKIFVPLVFLSIEEYRPHLPSLFS